MQTVRIYRLKNMDRRTRTRLKTAQLEAARVWVYCVGRHQSARAERIRWPDRDDLQRETKGGQFALHSQSIQMVCQQFLANVQTIKQLRQTNPRHRYPYHPQKYMTVQWPAQAVSREGNRLILPMGRGRASFTFHLPDLPDQIGAVSLVLQARCQKGSRRWRRLQYTRARESGKKERRVRDLRHKGTRLVVDYCRTGNQQPLSALRLEAEAERTELDLSALWL